MNINEIKWIFFDLGSTLIDEHKAFQDRINRMSGALAAFNIIVSTQDLWNEFEKAAADFSPRYVNKVLEKFCPNNQIRKYVSLHSQYNSEYEKPYPDSKVILEKLSSHYRIGIIANQKPGTRQRLKNFEMWRWISLLISSDEVNILKPDPSIFHLAIAQANCSEKQAAMIGDRVDHDILPANRLGWNTIRILQGFASNQQSRNADERPDITIQQLKEIHDIFLAHHKV